MTDDENPLVMQRRKELLAILRSEWNDGLRNRCVPGGMKTLRQRYKYVVSHPMLNVLSDYEILTVEGRKRALKYAGASLRDLLGLPPKPSTPAAQSVFRNSERRANATEAPNHVNPEVAETLRLLRLARPARDEQRRNDMPPVATASRAMNRSGSHSFAKKVVGNPPTARVKRGTLTEAWQRPKRSRTERLWQLLLEEWNGGFQNRCVSGGMWSLLKEYARMMPHDAVAMLDAYSGQDPETRQETLRHVFARLGIPCPEPPRTALADTPPRARQRALAKPKLPTPEMQPPTAMPSLDEIRARAIRSMRENPV